MCDNNKLSRMNRNKKCDVEFGVSSVPDLQMKVKKSLPEARRFTEKDQNRTIRQRGNQY